MAWFPRPGELQKAVAEEERKQAAIKAELAAAKAKLPKVSQMTLAELNQVLGKLTKKRTTNLCEPFQVFQMLYNGKLVAEVNIYQGNKNICMFVDICNADYCTYCDRQEHFKATILENYF